jgi:signal transduction histidine kinase
LPAQIPAHPLTTDERHNLFLAFKEALNNIVKHASASEVWVRVAVNKPICLITIEDNGKGFAVETARPGGNGLGSMCERLIAIGGEFRLESQPGQGTRLQLLVNLKQSRKML